MHELSKPMQMFADAVNKRIHELEQERDSLRAVCEAAESFHVDDDVIKGLRELGWNRLPLFLELVHEAIAAHRAKQQPATSFVQAL